MKRKLHLWLLALSVVFVASCSKDENVTMLTGPYDNGFFILNEGNYGKTNSNVGFYDYEKDSIVTQTAYTDENPGKSLGALKQILEFGKVFNGRLYLVVTLGGPLVVVNPSTLKEINRTADIEDGARSFVGVSNSQGLLSTEKGVYRVDLNTLALGEKIAGITDDVRDMVKVNNYIFLLSASRGVIVLNVGDFSIAKIIAGATSGFAVGKETSVYATGARSLIKINSRTLATEEISTNFDVYYNPYVAYSGTIAASTTENAIYIFSGYHDVYKYIDGNAASLSTPFITLPATNFLYAKGIGYDPKKDHIVLTTTDDMYGGQLNGLFRYNASTGTLINTFNYEGALFPAMTVFH